VGWHIIAQQEKISRAEHSWTNPLHALQEAIHYSFINFCIYCFSLWYELFVHYALRVKKIINMFLRHLWNFSFFGRWDVSPTRSELCYFVSGSKAKHQVSIFLNNFVKKFLSALAIAIMSWQDVTQSSLCSVSRSVEQNVHTTFSFPNPLSESKVLESWGCSKIMPSFSIRFNGHF